MKAWHFVRNTLRDGSRIPKDGEWLSYTSPIIICFSGLHASEQPWDAFQYAPGTTLCYVECEGIVAKQEDKFVCSRRKIVSRINSTELLKYFARWCALSVIDKWNPPQVVLDYLMTGNHSKRAAAEAAARAAARDAAEATAWAAARATAEAAAWAAAWAAARATAEATAEADARDAARDAQRKQFNKLVYESFGNYIDGYLNAI